MEIQGLLTGIHRILIPGIFVIFLFEHIPETLGEMTSLDSGVIAFLRTYLCVNI